MGGRRATTRRALGTGGRVLLLLSLVLATLGMGAAGGGGAAALPLPGRVWAWGWDGFGQLGDGVVTHPASEATPRQGRNIGNAVAVSAGNNHSLALLDDARVAAWGDDTLGQLGDGTLGPDAPNPQRINLLHGIVAVAAGGYHNLALQADGTVWAWGNDEFGELGDGAIGGPDLQPAPAVVGGLVGMSAIAAGAEHSIAIGIGVAGDQVGLIAQAAGPGTIGPGTGNYARGVPATLLARPHPGAVFSHWLVDGLSPGWSNPLTLTMDEPHEVVAVFAGPPIFTDVAAGQVYAQAVWELAARGIIKGHDDGRFGPNDTILRAQMAALIARTNDWAGPAAFNPFTDRCDPLAPGDSPARGATSRAASPIRRPAPPPPRPATRRAIPSSTRRRSASSPGRWSRRTSGSRSPTIRRSTRTSRRAPATGRISPPSSPAPGRCPTSAPGTSRRRAAGSRAPSGRRSAAITASIACRGRRCLWAKAPAGRFRPATKLW